MKWAKKQNRKNKTYIEHIMRQTIKNHRDFAMPDNMPVCITRLFIAKARPTLWNDNPKYGLVATKRTFKLAVQRNRAKRLLRTWIRNSEKSMDDNTDYVFIARSAILDASLDDGLKTMEYALKKINVQQ
jgi:ribonuclease P protein component